MQLNAVCAVNDVLVPVATQGFYNYLSTHFILLLKTISPKIVQFQSHHHQILSVTFVFVLLFKMKLFHDGLPFWHILSRHQHSLHLRPGCCPVSQLVPVLVGPVLLKERRGADLLLCVRAAESSVYRA